MHTDNHTNTDTSSKAHLHLNHSKAFNAAFFFFFLLFFCYRRPLLIKTKRQGARQQPGRSRDLNASGAVVLF